jgi:plastocyanin
VTRRRLALLLSLVALVAVAPAAVPGAAAARSPATSEEFVTVSVRDNAFRAQTITVTPGTVVRWVNDGRNVHNVRPDEGFEFGSRKLTRGQSYAFQFDDPGTYGYYCSLHGAPGKGQFGAVVVGDVEYEDSDEILGRGDEPAPRFQSSGRVIEVPADAPTIQAGVDRARTGDLVLVSPGVYRESVTVSTDGIVVRGLDRNRTILDGQFRRENGVKVVGADGVAIENLTARNYTFNGFYWTGVLGYRASYLTAYRNGDYGIYAFDSQWGTFEHSYASGSPDSGFYIGQCDPCHAVVDDVVAEYNQLGYSGTNASGDLHIVRSVWRANRVGIVPNSLDSEELAPQGRAVIVANLVEGSGTTSARAPQSPQWDVVFGAGIALVGANGDEVVGNRVVGSATVGIAIAPNPGLFGDSNFPASGNQVRDNDVRDSKLADLAVILPSAHDGNCFSGNSFTTSAPTGIEALLPCGGPPGADPATAPGALDIAQFLDVSSHPEGTPYRRTPVPRPQPRLPAARSAPARPAGAPVVPDLGSLQVPRGAG